jgi:transposase-like protein
MTQRRFPEEFKIEADAMRTAQARVSEALQNLQAVLSRV